MGDRARQLWDRIRSSYWFWPSLMALGAVGLAFLSTWADQRFGGGEWMHEVAWLFDNQPDGARALLSTIAGSMITVAGVSFSITIAAIVYTTSQFGPRLLTTFMRDTGNQLVLGTYIASFLYGILVLRTVRGAEEAPPGRDPASLELAGAFVPQFSILIAIALAGCGVAVLIYFIHHVPESVHISNVTARIGREMLAQVQQRFPEGVGVSPAVAAPGLPEADIETIFAKAAAVCAENEGYLQWVREAELFELACLHGVAIGLGYRPGEFVPRRRALAHVAPAERLTPEIAEAIGSCFALASQRSIAQDVLFPASELVEIAGRALSPGVNDPNTANTCTSWLAAGLAEFAARDEPSPSRHDEHGALRLVSQPIDFERFASEFIDRLRPYAVSDRNATLHLLRSLGEIAPDLQRGRDRDVLAAHVQRLREEALATIGSEHDHAEIERAARQVLAEIGDPGVRPRVRWTAGIGVRGAPTAAS